MTTGLAVEAAELLREILADGPRPAQDAKRELREALGDVSEGLIAKARRIAGVEAHQRGFHGGWEWRLLTDSRGQMPWRMRGHVLDEERPTRERLALEARRVRLFNKLIFKQRAAYGLVTRQALAAILRELDRVIPLDTPAGRSRRGLHAGGPPSDGRCTR